MIGISTGLYMLIARNYFDEWPNPDLVSAHTHMILVGSVMMMIMGVALWFFPRAEKNDRLYKPTLILITYYTITISTAVRFIAQVTAAYVQTGGVLKFLLTISSIFQVAAILMFFISMWGRIRSVGSHLREAKGEKF